MGKVQPMPDIADEEMQRSDVADETSNGGLSQASGGGDGFNGGLSQASGGGDGFNGGLPQATGGGDRFSGGLSQATGGGDGFSGGLSHATGGGDRVDSPDNAASSILARRRGNRVVLSIPALSRSLSRTGPGPSTAETVAEGENLFRGFLQREIQNEHLEHYVNTLGGGDSVPMSPLRRTGPACPNAAVQMMAKELLKIADDFRASRQRQDVADQANGLNFNALGKDQFLVILNTMFEGGITRERIIVVFFFCRDMAIRALRDRAVDYFRRFIIWSLEFIREKVCAWVQEHGGWSVVLSHSLDYMYRVCTVVGGGVLMALASLFILKQLRHN